MAGRAFSDSAASEDRGAPRPYHHLVDGRFRNPPGSPARTTTFGHLYRFMWRQWRQRKPEIAIPDGHVLGREEVARQLDRYADRDSITWLGHACFLIRIAGKTVLTDPYLGTVAGPKGLGPKRYVPAALRVDELPPIDLLLVSHNHYDHLDRPTLARLAGKDRVEVLAPLRLGRFFRRLGYARVHELDWYEEQRFGPLRVTALPAVHFSRRGPFDCNRSLWLGFAVESEALRLYFAGDTAYGEVFREIGQRAGPFDLAIVPIGAYLPREIMHASHTTPEEALQLAADIGAEAVLGMHWGTVVLTEEDQFEPPQRFRAAAEARGLAPKCAWLMAIGETRPLARPWPRN
jgi:L-ascorbate metabolism protein UlaG (beta-lactamase superfamily)